MTLTLAPLLERGARKSLVKKRLAFAVLFERVQKHLHQEAPDVAEVMLSAHGHGGFLSWARMS